MKNRGGSPSQPYIPLDEKFVQDFLDQNDHDLSLYNMAKYIDYLIENVIKNILQKYSEQKTLETTDKDLFSESLFYPNHHKKDAFAYQQAVESSEHTVNDLRFKSLFIDILNAFIEKTYPEKIECLKTMSQNLGSFFGEHIRTAQQKRRALNSIKQRNLPKLTKQRSYGPSSL